MIAPVLGSYVFFNFSDDHAMANVQWIYLAIGVFVLLLAVVFFFSNIPEITDAGRFLLKQRIQLATTFLGSLGQRAS